MASRKPASRTTWVSTPSRAGIEARGSGAAAGSEELVSSVEPESVSAGVEQAARPPTRSVADATLSAAL